MTAHHIDNRGPELIAVNVTFLVSTVISLSLRCYVRLFMVKAFGLDDILMVVAWVFFTLYASFSTAGAHYGTGRHHADLSDENIKIAKKCWWFCYLWYCLAMISSKISIGCFLLRVTRLKLHKWIIYIAMMCTGLSGLVFFFITMLQCSPIPVFWDKDAIGSCINIEVIIALAIVYSSFSVISDFTFAILPGVIVWNLQLKQRTKVLLIPLLVMGCIASCAVVVRFPFLPKFRLPDFLWNTTDIAIWSSVEQGLAITAGSLATLRPLIKRIGYGLGWTSSPSGKRVTDYGASSAPRTPGFSANDPYHMSRLGEQNGLEDGVLGYPRRDLMRGSKLKQASVVENESEEELHSPATWLETSDDHQAGRK